MPGNSPLSEINTSRNKRVLTCANIHFQNGELNDTEKLNYTSRQSHYRGSNRINVRVCCVQGWGDSICGK